MPDSISAAKHVTVAESCKLLPGRPCRNTVIRWMTRGYAGVILENWRCGNRRVTSVAAIDKFIAETTKAKDPNPRRSGKHKLAEAKLDAMGVA